MPDLRFETGYHYHMVLLRDLNGGEESDLKALKLMLPGIKTIDVMTISYQVVDSKGNTI
jgi:hypothetical protein